jgi:hypothetical protein
LGSAWDALTEGTTLAVRGTGFDWDNRKVVVKHRIRQTKWIRFIGTFCRI